MRWAIRQVVGSIASLFAFGRIVVHEVGQRAWGPSAVSRPARRAFRVAWHHLVVEDLLGPDDRFDAIFCFGSRHGRVPERAAALYREGRADRVLVTGGPAGPGEPSEAEAFGAALVSLGVDRSHLVLEPHAAHTGENVELGVAALGSVGPVGRLALVAWPLAARRVQATFARHHPGIEVASAPALRRPGWRWCPTPKRIRLAIGELDRLDRYGCLGWIEPRPLPPEVADALAVLRAEVEARDPAGSGRVELRDASAAHATLGEVEPARPGIEAEEPTLVVVER